MLLHKDLIADQARPPPGVQNVQGRRVAPQHSLGE
jgi:hypothetical protein